MKIIGLTGLARSGKDTACGYILEWAVENGITAKRAAFADKLKESAAGALGYPGDDPIGFCEALKHNGQVAYWFPNEGMPDPSESNGQYITGREYLQRFGTESHREVFGDDFWVDALMDDLHDDPPGDLVVITDCRFPNEAEAINSTIEGEVWEVIRSEAGLKDGLEAHASEAGVGQNNVGLKIDNNLSLGWFRGAVRNACVFNLKDLV